MLKINGKPVTREEFREYIQILITINNNNNKTGQGREKERGI